MARLPPSPRLSELLGHLHRHVGVTQAAVRERPLAAHAAAHASHVPPAEASHRAAEPAAQPRQPRQPAAQAAADASAHTAAHRRPVRRHVGQRHPGQPAPRERRACVERDLVELPVANAVGNRVGVAWRAAAGERDVVTLGVPRQFSAYRGEYRQFSAYRGVSRRISAYLAHRGAGAGTSSLAGRRCRG